LRRRGNWTVPLGIILSTACARYHPQPIDPAAYITEYRARRLNDPALLAWVTRWAGPISPSGWTDRQLAVAGLRLRADIERSRREWQAARAGEHSAGARPPVGANVDVERAVSGSDGQSPWVVAIGGLQAVELGGKRGARLAQARARTSAAQADLAIVSWRVVRDVRAAALAVALAEGERASVSRELTAMTSVQQLERQRFAEAAVTSSEVARTSSDVAVVEGAVAATERELIEARAGLAVAIGLPPRALDTVRVAPVLSSDCLRFDSLGADSLEAVALSARPEIARALAGYAAAEADLRFQVARQFPDLDVGPGFIWDQGVHRWTLALALPGLLAFRNKAPIAEAEASRRTAAARVMEAQESILGELAAAEESCRGAQIERVAADSQLAVAQRSLERANAAYERGETGRLDAALAELAVVRAESARRAAERQIALAGLAVEAATSEWRGGPGARWPDPRSESGEEAMPR
jgi:cobalt-zinc-cadmium efflux system outer membrane protein